MVRDSPLFSRAERLVDVQVRGRLLHRFFIACEKSIREKQRERDREYQSGCSIFQVYISIIHVCR